MPSRLQPPPKHRILIVDEHPVVRESLGLRISREPDLEVCDSVGNVAAALMAVEQHHPDLAIIEINLPDGHGLDLIKEIRSRDAKVRMIVFSMHDEHIYGERALRAGAHGYLMKSEPPDRLVEGIRLALAGQPVISQKLSGRLLSSFTPGGHSDAPEIGTLSDRELEVFQLMGQGLSTKDIANRLRRSPKTIETYRLRIKEKLGVGSAQALVAMAARWVIENQ